MSIYPIDLRAFADTVLDLARDLALCSVERPKLIGDHLSRKICLSTNREFADWLRLHSDSNVRDPPRWRNYFNSAPNVDNHL